MRSQRHALDIRGEDSTGNLKGLGRIINDKCIVSGGANSSPAVVQLDGWFKQPLVLNLTVDHNGTSSTIVYVNPAPSPGYPARTPEECASGLAAAIEADTTVGGLVTAVAKGDTIHVTNQSTATNGDTVTLSNLHIYNF